MKESYNAERALKVWHTDSGLRALNSSIFVFDQALPGLSFSSSKCCKVTIITRRVESDRASSWRHDPVHLHHTIAQLRCQHQSMGEKERSTTCNDIRRDPSTWYLSCLCSSETEFERPPCGISCNLSLRSAHPPFPAMSTQELLCCPLTLSLLSPLQLLKGSRSNRREILMIHSMYIGIWHDYSHIAFASGDMLASAFEQEKCDWKD